jgi:hypothetical protein
MASDWATILARIEELSRQVDEPLLWSTAAAFVTAVTPLPPPDDVGLGYWRTSIRMSWENLETEIFPGSVEIYRFDEAGTQIATIPFQPGDALPPQMSHLADRKRTTDQTS